MLQILVHGPKGADYIDLTPGTTLQLQELLPAFDTDLSTGEFTLPIEVPWTDHNRKLLEFAEMLQFGNKETYYWRCDVFSDGLPEIIDGKLTLLKKAGRFDYKEGTFSFSISGNKGLFGTLIRNKRLTDLELGGKVSWSALSSRQFAEEVMKGLRPQYSYLGFAPVAIEDFFDTQRPGYDGEFIVFDTVNNTLATGATENAWTFARPQVANPALASVAGTEEYIDYRTIPFFNFYYLVRQVFTENGYTVTGDFFSSGYWNDLYLFNNFAIERYNDIWFDTNREIIPKNHVPDVLIRDFLVQLCAFFNVEMIWRPNRTVELRYKINKLKDMRVLNVSSIANIRFNSEMLNYREDGFTFKHEFDSEDSLPGERIQDLDELTLVGTVTTAAALSTIDPGRDLTTSDIAFVTAENMYYRVADGTVIPALWDCFSQQLDELKIGNGDIPIGPTLSPLVNHVKENSVSALMENKYIAAARQRGSFVNMRGLSITNPFGLRAFFIQKENQGGAMVPVSFVHNRDRNNVKRTEISLSWHGSEGLYEKLHKTWISFLQKTIQVSTRLYVDQKWLQQLDQASLLEINGVLYVLQGTSKQLPMRDAIEVTMYRYAL